MLKSDFIIGFNGLENTQLDYFTEKCEEYMKCIAQDSAAIEQTHK